MKRRNMRVPWVDHRTNPAGKERHLLTLRQLFPPGIHLSHCGRRDHSVDDRHPDPGLLKDVTILDDAGDPTASLLSVPTVHSKFMCCTLLCLESPTKLPLLEGKYYIYLAVFFGSSCCLPVKPLWKAPSFASLDFSRHQTSSWAEMVNFKDWGWVSHLLSQTDTNWLMC